MLDPSIIMRGAERAQLQQQQNMEALGELGGNFGKLVLGRRVNQMQQLKPEERQAFANNSIFSTHLNNQLKADKAAEAQALRDQQKHDADVYNIRAQGSERIANAGKTTQEAGANQYGLGRDVWMAVTQSGNLNAGKMLLNRHLASGAIDQPTYDALNSQLTALEGQEPSAVQAAAFNQAKSTLDPKYNFATVDAQETNATSIKNNELDNQTSLKRLKQESEQYQQNFEYTAQQDEIKNGQAELKEFGGKTWIVYKNGDYRPAIGADGNQISASKAETPEQKMQRVDNALGAADAARAAARASQDAANLINDPGLYWGTGTTSALGLIPGSDAKGFHARLENLKSQVFLPTVKALQGMGALSNAEGEKISAAVANLDPKIGPEAMKEQLTVLAKQMRDAAKTANQRTQNYASRGGTIPLSVTSKKRGANENPPPKGSSASLNEVKQAAQQAGISTEEMASILKSQGVSIK